MNIYRLLLVFCLSVVSMISYSDVYRWVDEKGKVHYGDRPAGVGKEDVKEKQEHLSTGTKSKDADATGKGEQEPPPSRTEELTNQAEEIRAAREKEAAKQRAHKENMERRADCRQSRRRIKELQEQINQFMRRKTGKTTQDRPETVMLDKENTERAREIKSLEAHVEKNCKDH